MSKKRKIRENYFIKVDKELVPVTREVYEAYYEMENRERYLQRLDRKYGLLFFGGLEDSAGFADSINDVAVDVEKVVMTGLVLEELRSSLACLNNFELELLTEIYFNEKPIRAIARERHVSDTLLRKKRDMILDKLRNKLLK